MLDGRFVHGPVRGVRAAFEEAGRQECPEQLNTTRPLLPGALTWAAHNRLSHLVFIKLIMLVWRPGLPPRTLLL